VGLQKLRIDAELSQTDSDLVIGRLEMVTGQVDQMDPLA